MDVDGRLVNECSVPQKVVAAIELILDRTRLDGHVSSHTPLVKYVIEVMEMAE